MPSKRLTQVVVDGLLPPAAGRRDVYDAVTPGLVLRITHTGVKTWSICYQVKGRPRRLTLGSLPGVSLKLARDRAREARASLQRGADPVQEKKDAEREASIYGFESCVTDYVAKYAKAQQKTWKETERVLKRLAIPEFTDRPVKEIRRRDVVDLLDRVGARAPYAANQLRAHLSRMFNWLVEREVIEASPLVGARPRSLGPPRDRVLSDEELGALWRSAGELGGPYGAAVRFIILTGLRKENASSLRWEQVEGDWAVFSADEMKGGRVFRAPLSPAAKAIVAAQPKFKMAKGGTGPYVFTSSGTHGLSNWSDEKKALEEMLAAKFERTVPDWRLHDLRRTLGHGLARLGFPLEVRKRVLDHKADSRDVTASVYTWHSFDAEAMVAAKAWADYVAKLVEEKEQTALIACG